MFTLSFPLSVLALYLLCSSQVRSQVEDKLDAFYERLHKSDVKYCSDRTRLLPDCKECIPGLQQSANSKTCDEFIPSSKGIRDEIRNLVIQRFGKNGPKNREFGLYPCKWFSLLYISQTSILNLIFPFL
jgi:hypothetical protein